MANDRMFLVCKCGGRFCLAKHFQNPWKPSNEFERFGEWIREHSSCDPHGDYPHYEFKLAFESDGPPPPAGA